MCFFIHGIKAETYCSMLRMPGHKVDLHLPTYMYFRVQLIACIMVPVHTVCIGLFFWSVPVTQCARSSRLLSATSLSLRLPYLEGLRAGRNLRYAKFCRKAGSTNVTGIFTSQALDIFQRICEAKLDKRPYGPRRVCSFALHRSDIPRSLPAVGLPGPDFSHTESFGWQVHVSFHRRCRPRSHLSI